MDHLFPYQDLDEFEESAHFCILPSQMSLVVKNPPANAGDARDRGLQPLGQEDPLEEMATHSSILYWKTLWTEECGRL